MRFFLCIVLLSIISTLLSCEKVISLELHSNDEQYVIEGIITNEPSVCYVSLSKTRHFNDDNQFETISGAIVTVKDNGTLITLTETRPGYYETKSLTGMPAHIYELSVVIENNRYSATCTMPQAVALDTLYISEGPFGQFSFPTVSYTDPQGINNGYRFVQYVNSVKDPAIFWEDDEFTDGQQVALQLDNGITEKDDPRNIKPGDEVMIELQSVDEAIYKFWYTMESGGGAGINNTVAPADPVTNIRGGALGYFSAHTIDRRKVIAP